MKITGVVIAGGKSSRMGTDKAFIQYEGKSLIEHSIDLLKNFCNQLYISAGRNSEKFASLKVPVLQDVYPEIGPIGGIHAALTQTDTDYILVIPCDTPLLNPAVLYRLIEQAEKASVVYSEIQNKKEPLVALYSKGMLPHIESMIASGNYKLQDVIKHSGAKSVTFHRPEYFINLNRPSDLEAISGARGSFPGLLLVAGNGRNVGKTYFTCRLIEHLSRDVPVIAIKISPHFHTEKQGELVYETTNCTIYIETEENRKDSSLMKQAGANKSYFVMSKDEGLPDVMEYFEPVFRTNIVVCEAGGLISQVNPFLFFFLKLSDQEVVKPWLLEYDPVVVCNTMKSFSFDINQLEVRQNRIQFKKNNSNEEYCSD